ncbi:MAG: putative TonB, C-terminal, partial [Rubritepida sp.]|nr:putative TonB, C-terminal [Rubritepida sp.]
AEGARSGADATPSPAAGIGRATGAVVPPGPDPRYRNAAPGYPEASRLRGEQGAVVLELSVNVDGRVVSAQVLGSSGSQALDEAARRTVAEWRLRPATVDGQPVPGAVRTTIHFRLQ